MRFDKGKYDVNIKTTGKSSPEFAPYPTHSAKKDAERRRKTETEREDEKKWERKTCKWDSGMQCQTVIQFRICFAIVDLKFFEQ